MTGGDLFDVHAALGREQQQRALGSGMVEHGRVHLARDRHLLLDQNGRNAMLADRHAEDGGSGCRASCGEAASLMPPALPRLPVGTCALTTHRPDPARGRGCLICRARARPRVWRCRGSQQRLGRMLLEVQPGPPRLGGRSASQTTAAVAAARAFSKLA